MELKVEVPHGLEFAESEKRVGTGAAVSMVIGNIRVSRVLYGGVGGDVPGIDLMRGSPEVCL